MENVGSARRIGQMTWGLFLIALGAAYLLGRAGMVEVPRLWELWPAVLVVIGLNAFFERRPGTGAMLMLMGAAFFAAVFGWLGLTYATFWPLLLVAVGVGIVIRVFSREDECRKCCGRSCSCRESAHEEEAEACHE